METLKSGALRTTPEAPTTTFSDPRIVNMLLVTKYDRTLTQFSSIDSRKKLKCLRLQALPAAPLFA